MVKEPTTDELSAQPEYLTEEARQAAVDEIAGLKIIYKDFLDAHDGAPPTNKECTKTQKGAQHLFSCLITWCLNTCFGVSSLNTLHSLYT